MRRLLVPGPLHSGSCLLPKAEADHARTVLRLQVDDEVVVQDGEGAEATARLIEVTRKGVVVEVREPTHCPPAAAARLVCATAQPKGGRWEDMIRSLTELGVGTIAPVTWQRSVRFSDRTDRAQRAAAEALKQSRRLWMPRILDSQPALDLAFEPGQAFLAEPDGPPLSSLSLPASGALTIFIGPEGGITDEERMALVQRGVQPVCLAPHILRIETAALAMAACLVASLPKD